MIASAFDEGTVYAAQSGYRNDDFAAYLFRSTDYGHTWESLAAGLPAEPVNVVREDPKARHLLYVGTDAGAFVSLDRGKTWTALTGGLPHVAVQDLAVHPREGDLVLATHGRSVYLAEAAPLRKLTEEAMARPLVALPVKSVQGDPRRGYGGTPTSPGSATTPWCASRTGRAPPAPSRSRPRIRTGTPRGSSRSGRVEKTALVVKPPKEDRASGDDRNVR